uniref:Nei like DNA glycosylase 1 n=1 Tax=Ursus maritimus TaxID=29073 RepID=A0A452TE04_URSMA
TKSLKKKKKKENGGSCCQNSTEAGKQGTGTPTVPPLAPRHRYPRPLSPILQQGLRDRAEKGVSCARALPPQCQCSPRENVLRNLADKVFDQPICEALLDQRFFNGIGNYLRAEILYRLRIPPFEKARKVLEALQQRRPSPELTLSQKIRAKLRNPDLLELCHSVPKEVVQLGGKGYGPESGEEDFAAFRAWLRCYGMPGMSSLRDRRGRTIWFQGASPTRRNPREHGRGLSTGWRTLCFQARPLPGHVGHGEALQSKVKPSSLRGPASNRTQRSPQSPRREKGGGDQQPQATADPEGSRLTPHPWRMRGWQPLSGRASLFVSTLFLCHALGPGAWAAHWKQLGAAGGWVPLALWLFLAQLCF